MSQEIFDAFIKIAQEKGMISKDAPEKAKKILEKTHRADSLDISAIEALYGVKPDAPKDMEYKRNIIEDAHPEAVIISPSYDKLNGLVENNNERQDIILHIVNKVPNGHLTQHKYAEQDLILTLVRVANDLDNQNNDQLRVLADTCLEQATSKSFKKGGAFPLLVIPALVAATYLHQHMPNISQGFKIDHDRLVSEIDDLLQSSVNWGVGYTLSPEFKSQMLNFKDKLNAFRALYDKVEPIIANMEKFRTGTELSNYANTANGQAAAQAYKVLRSAIDNLKPILTKAVANFSKEDYKARQISDKGFLTQLLDKTQMHGGRGFIADDFDDVSHAITPYLKSVTNILKALDDASHIETKLKEELDQAASESQSEFGQSTESKDVEGIDADVAGLENQMPELSVFK